MPFIKSRSVSIHKIKKCLLFIDAFIIPFSISLFTRKESYCNTLLSQNGTIIDLTQPRNKTIYGFSPSSSATPRIWVRTGRFTVEELCRSKSPTAPDHQSNKYLQLKDLKSMEKPVPFSGVYSIGLF
jgi:hypothetical protein